MSAPLGARPDRTRERVVTALAASLGILLPLGYALILALLVIVGAAKLFDVTPRTSSSVPGQGVLRVALAALVSGAVAWSGGALFAGLLRSLRGTSASRERVVRAAVWAITLLGALLLRNRLPPFLVDLPSELREGGGIGPQLFNTMYLAILSTAVTTPLAVAAAIYMARFARGRLLPRLLRDVLESLASLPTIIYGLFGFLVFVVQMRAGYSLMAGALTLALLNLPMVVAVTDESLRDVPRELEDASLALGATPLQTVLRVTLPAAWRGILGAVVLGIGRVFAESAPLMLTAGTAVSRATAYSLDPMRGGETLAVHLWYVNSVGLSPDRAEVSAGTAAVLVILVATMDAVSARLRRTTYARARKRSSASQATV